MREHLHEPPFIDRPDRVSSAAAAAWLGWKVTRTQALRRLRDAQWRPKYEEILQVKRVLGWSVEDQLEAVVEGQPQLWARWLEVFLTQYNRSHAGDRKCHCGCGTPLSAPAFWVLGHQWKWLNARASEAIQGDEVARVRALVSVEHPEHLATFDALVLRRRDNAARPHGQGSGSVSRAREEPRD